MSCNDLQLYLRPEEIGNILDKNSKTDEEKESSVVGFGI